ncbi:acyltransferase domain-containing protein [Aureimonas glaciei]|uniref:Polyketide biosynthesis acyltransferase PksD n=1 Tax=Aureimonas glaciei TaxID=1776957 RepID=A0A917DAR2_9HYPH|nr:acyltransferase domain-containing protein [Aureimonas glaciei]GGD19216.1 polyketide biosynthesis acyltransferase PksD [Aureimonas glaciei]
MASLPSSLPLAFCFAGQGAQYHHMAADFMETQPVFRRWMEIGDKILRLSHGFSPLAQIYAAGRTLSDPFDRLEHSHPALFMTQFATAKMLQDMGVRPDLILGVSLGEFVAMSLSGMVPFETALRAVARQPAIFADTSPAGALVAVLGPPDLRVQSAILTDLTEVASFNAERHCVLACPAVDTARVLAELRRLDVAFQPLPVPFAFHSRWIEPARERYLASVSDLTFEQPFWPVWSACFARPLAVADAEANWRIVRDPIRLGQTIAALEAAGGAHYLDLSPTGSLAAVLRQALAGDSPSRISALLSPFGGNLKRLEEIRRTRG